ncbi:hypothetical protein IW262DRAFT_1405549 [Armillaria fumosa]|nr:hypothetical protein IW262DRAFT_1405549 [Armillaria fumosa]
MHDSLTLCTNLECIAVCVDEERAQITGSDNIIIQLMKSLKWWPFLRNLRIQAVVNIETGQYAHEDEPPRTDVCVRVHNLVIACRYKDPSPQMLALWICTDLVFFFELRHRSLPSEGYSFFSDYLSSSAKRVLKAAATEARRGPPEIPEEYDA